MKRFWFLSILFLLINFNFLYAQVPDSTKADNSKSAINTVIKEDTPKFIKSTADDKWLRFIVYDPYSDGFVGIPIRFTLRVLPLFFGFSIHGFGMSLGSALGEVSMPLYVYKRTSAGETYVLSPYRLLPTYLYFYYIPKFKKAKRGGTLTLLDLIGIKYTQTLPYPIFYGYVGGSSSSSLEGLDYYKRVGAGVYYQINTKAGIGFEISTTSEDILVNYQKFRSNRVCWGIILTTGAWRSPQFEFNLLED
ncbi:MAG: hypothetical protein ACPLN0_06680 [Candidatus Hydrothermia bacterium]